METSLNHKEFASRLQKIMDNHQLSAAAFSEKLEVGRATISHLMSGRNKPSLDFVMKVISTFKTVDLYWLIYGDNSSKNIPYSTNNKESEIIKNKQSQNSQNSVQNQFLPSNNFQKIKRVILLLEDGSFESYEM